ncbi:hypothetical protein CAEBREN_16501 [Caenorhabditis brenneri]|uniref:Serpentine Receptor, class H n=1 Tax=Caenorhabditis brenneri TaxID=135651 RepID=G0MU01_CAEBE|nr:hypothetical protein CAEBREN_16501 [Caenorhabditis brenneri]
MFPALAGFPQGILVEFGVPTAFQVYLVITIFGVVGVAMICIMENRFHLLFANQSWWNRARIPYLVINYLYALTFCLYPVLHPPEQKYAIEVVRRRLPEIPSIFFENPVYVLALELRVVAASVLIFSIICINQSFIFVYLLISKFEECSQNMTLSVRTIRLQKRFMKAISIQAFVPLLLLIFPMFYYGPATLFNYYNQKFNNICFITISLHGLVSTIVMLFIHVPYRNFCYRTSRKYFRFCLKKQIVVGVAMICIMENRFHLLFANQSWWNRARIPYLVINYLYAITFCLYPVLHPPEQKYAIEVVRRRNSIRVSSFSLSLIAQTPNFAMTNVNIPYIPTPGFVIQCYHILSCFEVPIHLFGAYVIIFVTPGSMKSVKWSLLNVHFWSAFLDWSFSILTVPYMLLPTMAGTSMGFLTFIGVPIRFHAYIVVCVFATAGTSIVAIAENRLYTLFLRSHWWRKARLPFLVLHYLLPPLCFVFMFLNVPNQQTALENLKKKIRIDPLIFEYDVFVLAEDFLVMMTCCVFFATIYISEIMIMVCLLIINLEKETRNARLSKRTMKLQSNLLRAVMIQVLTPYIFVVLPLFYIGPSIILGYYNQSLNNISIMIISIHGSASTIVMLMIHKPYRTFCQNVFCLKHKSVFDNSGRNSVNPVVARDFELDNIFAADPRGKVAYLS